ncbi:MAG: uncharacterized protein QOF76_1095 [Solirubrobacteraceae bacterium]|nr:uncharacterized protein [Solirubrobacteraceae bacterium]
MCALVLAGLLAPARADALFVFLVDANTVRGHVSFTAIASLTYSHIVVGEEVGGRTRPVATFTPLTPTEGTDFGTSIIPNSDVWRCGRRDRHYVSTATDDSGASVTQHFEVRLPSCADRLRLTLPAHVTRAADAPIRVTDGWGAGDVSFRLCVKPPAGAARCRHAQIPAGQRTTDLSAKVPTKGAWTVRLERPGERLERTLAVGIRATPADARLARRPVVLATGDSLMQSVGVQLHDLLGDRAEVYDDVFVGTGIIRPFLVDWHVLPAYQVAVYHPEAIAVLLGANDRYPIGDVECCSQQWIDLYAQQVRGVMRIYAQHGRAKVVYITIPNGSDGPRNDIFAADNAAMRQAARGLRGVRILDFAQFFTPGGLFPDVISYHGHLVDARVDDGLHFTIAGAKIAARLIEKAFGSTIPD